MKLKSIGEIVQLNDEYQIKIKDEFKLGLTGLEEFSSLHVLWFADNNNIDEYSDFVLSKPYKKGPSNIGVFATRSQIRPNPICSTLINIKSINIQEGYISTFYIDAFPGTQILDIKPFLPCSDITKNIVTPIWCKHWPKNIESSGVFNWSEEFNFE